MSPDEVPYFEALEALEARLERERPVPAPSFRGDLRRAVIALGHPRRRRWRLGASLAATGATFLAVAAIGLAGVGPLAPAQTDDAAQAQVR